MISCNFSAVASYTSSYSIYLIGSITVNAIINNSSPMMKYIAHIKYAHYLLIEYEDSLNSYWQLIPAIYS